jgi:glycosyltransferase involved in cell wall biosynthesis
MKIAETVAPPPVPPDLATGLKILVVIPVYNHAKTVAGVAQRALDQGFPVLVVDDGSTDGSFDAVSALPLARHRMPVNGGKGGAILAAAALADEWGYEAMVTIDADGQHDPADAMALVDAAFSGQPAIVIGARRMDGEHVPRSSVFGREFSNFWVRLECGETLPDTQSGYRLYPVELLRKVRFLSRGYTFEIEVLVRGRWAGLPIVSVPVPVYYPPGDERISHFHKLKDNLRLSLLHTYLVTRSLIPWRHRRLFADQRGQQPSIFQPRLYLKALSSEHSSERELAAAVWVGIFLGALPIIPFGIATIVYASHRLHLNKLASVGASNVCCAPFVPMACVELGHFVLYGRFWYEFNRHTMLEELHRRLWEWLIGSLVIGPILATAGALLTWWLIRWYRMRNGRNNFIKEKAEAR